MKLTHHQIRKLIRLHYEIECLHNEWVVLFDLRLSTGFRDKYTFGKATAIKHIDAMAFNCWPSKHLRRIAFEIKVSRPDFLKELKQPEKRWLAMLYSHYYYFVTPPALLKPSEIPQGCGLIKVIKQSDHHRLFISKPAPLREASPLPESFIASALRNAYRLRKQKDSSRGTKRKGGEE